jgi:hypothetical protein
MGAKLTEAKLNAAESLGRDAMETIEEIRTAEKRVQRTMDALMKAPANDPNNLVAELQRATDEYARLVRKLSSRDTEPL